MKELESLTPKKIVEALDHYIVGQKEAKRVVAIAIRNRWRRSEVEGDIRNEITPKNIMLIGPTGVGKTEIARRLANLVQAPFLKVEATKYTEVGYVGRSVDTMIRDLVETSMRMVRTEELERVKPRARELAEEKLLDRLLPGSKPTEEGEEVEDRATTREKLRGKLRKGELEAREVEVEVEERQSPLFQMFSETGMEEMGVDVGNLFGGQGRKVSRTVKVRDARGILAAQQAEKLIDRDHVNREGLRRAQENGLVFIDEIDKVVASGGQHGPDVSREGVQRDLLPIVEGATVNTRYGPVRTDHILFIAAGAFSTSKPNDLIPELQGRFPLRAELDSLTQADFERILTQPRNAITRQAVALLKTERVEIEWKSDGITEMASLATQINQSTQNIGARRLHTVVEKVLDEISFQAPEIAPCRIPIDAKFVQERIRPILETEDLKRYIL